MRSLSLTRNRSIEMWKKAVCSDFDVTDGRNPARHIKAGGQRFIKMDGLIFCGFLSRRMVKNWEIWFYKNFRKKGVESAWQSVETGV